MILNDPSLRAHHARRLRGEHDRGKSVLSLSRAYNLDRGTIGRLIREAGGEVRGRSAAHVVRLKNEGVEGRKHLVLAANKARRNSSASSAELLKKAEVRCRLRGHGEMEMKEALAQAGLPADAQTPCGVYNLDIGIGDTVAVEMITQGNFRPHTTKFRDRVEYCANAGRCLIFVTFRHDRKDTVIGNLDEIVAFVKRAYRSPALRRKHWVIRCRSERFSRSRNDLGQLAVIRTAERFFNVVSELDLR